ncbi:hypothetical protein SAMD00019534_075430 [Acytostelium subglobosum LB1]|uniref:hypothetical protein n=1 Tax=Acytostelium subglobosum LB1 TaxID=1410327 RepID=UPI000644B1D1|nr:hypothetical protein SAMD00019534_075430 [Acytostelium subglobosum LB1]GAM24368.1 hypothetical protein SAMD00019534_075430 [Acytostelium subglobosum LB1]|eukprot:XP_012752694.1 hypothetical protein SAMD00019534_075430 [Acytostelium subglobosum LB1]
MSSRLNPNSSMFMPMQVGRGNFQFVQPNIGNVMGHHGMGHNAFNYPFAPQMIMTQQQQQQQPYTSQPPPVGIQPAVFTTGGSGGGGGGGGGSGGGSGSGSGSSSSSSTSTSSSSNTSTSSTSGAAAAQVKANTVPYTQFKSLETATKYFTECTVKELQGHKKKVNSVSWSCDGKRLASGSWDQTARIWNIENPKQKELELRGHSESIEQLRYSPTAPDVLATASSDKTVKIWDTRSGKCTMSIATSGENINLCWYVDGSLLAVGNKEDNISIIDLKRPDDPIIRTNKYQQEINEIIWDTTGQLFFMTTGTGLLDVMLWHPDSKKYTPLHTINGHTANLYTIEMDPLGRYFAIGSADSVVSLWDINEMYCLRSFTKLNAPVRTMGFSSDGQFLAYSSEEPFIEIGHVESGQSIFQIPVETGLNSIAWHPSEPLIAFASDDKDQTKDAGTIKIFGKFTNP